MRARLAPVVLLLVGSVAALAQGRDGQMKIKSSAFEPNGEIPPVHTCEGSDTSPPLGWEGVPANAKSLALIVDDPDAPDPKAPKRTWVHWVVYDIPPTATGLPAAATRASLPAGAREGKNDWNQAGYGGPCPPIGRHRYFFKLYALDSTLGRDGATKAEVEKAMKGHIVAQTEMIGTYQKKK
jgi:Raf kinase inhibitor-like YbhB/YbcL family protein